MIPNFDYNKVSFFLFFFYQIYKLLHNCLPSSQAQLLLNPLRLKETVAESLCNTFTHIKDSFGCVHSSCFDMLPFTSCL